MYANSWWKQKVTDRENHNYVMKILLLSPFLYGKVYQDEIWIEWAKSGKLLCEGRTSKMDELSDEELQSIDLMEITILKLQEKINAAYTSKDSPNGFIDDIIESVDACQKSKEIQKALEKVKDKEWFSDIKSKVNPVIAEAICDKCDAAILLVASHISIYVKQFVSLHKEFQDNSESDESSERSKKKGNESFKSGEYSKAITTYTAILYSKPYLHLVYGNRAICYIKKQQFRAALADGRRCITLNPKWHKGQQRYVQSLFELGYSDAATMVLNRAIEICETENLLVEYKKEITAKIQNDRSKIMVVGKESRDDKDFSCTDDLSEDTEDVPELVDASDDEEDEDTTQPKNNNTEKMEGKETLPPYVLKNTLHFTEEIAKIRREERLLKEQEEEEMEKKRSFYTGMKNGTLALLQKEKYRQYNAIDQFEQSFHSLDLYSDTLSIKEIVALHYAHAYSYLESGTPPHLEKALTMFKEIREKFKHLVFSLPLYGTGKALMKSKKYFLARKPLEDALKLQGNKECLMHIKWPGVDTIIKETFPGKLEKVVEELIKEIKNKRNAQCLFDKCREDEDLIYFDDPGFNGCIKLMCTENCVCEYHSSCWMRVRKTVNFANDELLDSFLTLPCFYPKQQSCEGLVTLIQQYGPDGKVIGRFSKTLSRGDVTEIKFQRKFKGKKPKKVKETTEEDKENSEPVKTMKKKKRKVKDWSKFIDFNKSDYQKNVIELMFEIFDFVEDILVKNEELFIDVNHNEDLKAFLKSKNFNPLLDSVGDLRTVFSKCRVFSFDEKQRNIIYLTARKEIYDNYKLKQKHHLNGNPPECEEPLFCKRIPEKSTTTKHSRQTKSSCTITSFTKSDGFNIINITSSNNTSCNDPLVIEEKEKPHNEKKDNSSIGKSNVKGDVDKSIGKKEPVVNEEKGPIMGFSDADSKINFDQNTDNINSNIENNQLLVANKSIQTESEDDQRLNILVKMNKQLDMNNKALKDRREELLTKINEDKKKLRASQDETNAVSQQLEKLKWDRAKQKQTFDNETRELKKDNEEQQSKIEHLEKRCSTLSKINEERINALLIQKGKEIDDLKRKTIQERKQDKKEHETIVQELTEKLQEQRKRAENAEVAQLEAKKKLVVIKYKQNAHMIQNTISRMQYLQLTISDKRPEVQAVLQIWEKYKFEYQNTYEKMQEEFSSLITSVKNGEQLESLPPARYGSPPPHPPLNFNQLPVVHLPPPPIPLPPQQQHIAPQEHFTSTAPSSDRMVAPNPAQLQPSIPQLPVQQVPLPQPEPIQKPQQQQSLTQQQYQTSNFPPLSSKDKPEHIQDPTSSIQKQQQSLSHEPTTNGAVAASPSSDFSKPLASQVVMNEQAFDIPIASTAPMTNSPRLNRMSNRGNVDGAESGEPKYGKNDEKVLMKLGMLFPTTPWDELLSYFKEYRMQGSLSGQRIEDIVSNVERIIRRAKQMKMEASKQVSKNQSAEPKVKKVPRVQGPSAVDHGGAIAKRTRANHVPTSRSGYTTSGSDQKLSIFGQEEPCVICYDDMSPNTEQMLHCGHTFHKSCISCWLKEQRTCPVCRVLALLPDEYPALG